MRLSDERLAQFAAAVARVGETRARSGLKALTLTLRYKSPIRDARDCEDLLNAIHNLPHILAEVRALRAVTALDKHFGYEADSSDGHVYGWYCRWHECGQREGEPHLDGCPVAAVRALEGRSSDQAAS